MRLDSAPVKSVKISILRLLCAYSALTLRLLSKAKFNYVPRLCACWISQNFHSALTLRLLCIYSAPRISRFGEINSAPLCASLRLSVLFTRSPFGLAVQLGAGSFSQLLNRENNANDPAILSKRNWIEVDKIEGVTKMHKQETSVM